MKPAFNYPLHFYAARDGESQDRLRSASGGIIPALGRYVLRHGGIVYGVRWNADFRAVMASATTEAEMDAFRGSKYVKAHISSEIYEDVVSQAATGRMVLFVGTPCQIAGLAARFESLPENLITVDLVCHGVSPESAFESELSHLRRWVRNFDDISFRRNDDNDFCLCFWREGKLIWARKSQAQAYFAAYLGNVNLSEACYKCPFARPERVGDLSVGDYIVGGTRNLSCLGVGTVKGKAFLEAVAAESETLCLEPRDYKERLTYAPALMEPAKPGKQRKTYLFLLKFLPAWLAVRLSLFGRLCSARLSLAVVSAKRRLGIKGRLFR